MTLLARRPPVAALAAVTALAATPATSAFASQAQQSEDGPSATPIERQPPRAPADDGHTGLKVALGLAGAAVGAAGVAAGVGFLFAGSDRGDEAAGLRTAVKADPGMALVTNNHCSHPNRPSSCDELEAAADDRVLFDTTGFLLLSGGAAVALAGGMLLALGIGGDGGDVAVRIMPAVGAGQLGATMKGHF